MHTKGISQRSQIMSDFFNELGPHKFPNGKFYDITDTTDMGASTGKHWKDSGSVLQ